LTSTEPVYTLVSTFEEIEMNKPMVELLSQALRGKWTCVAPEYPQQWRTYIKAEELGYVDGFEITPAGYLAVITKLSTSGDIA